ncbi:M48 family metallopeptidase [Candidatus Micrarchaeota archaeon]|nr:M48 family metallopeptidase [Candidatus Micrarchaeota archaeon]
MTSFYDEISRNKRDSYLLMLTVFLILIGIAYIVSSIFESTFLLILMTFISIVYILTGYYYSDRIVLAVSGAREADPKRYIYLHNVVEGLSIAAGIPKPKVYIINDDAPNAFATGRDPEHSAVVVTTGLLKIMNREELEGVISHEISHIKNYDIKFMTLIAVLVGLVSMIANISTRMLLFGRGNRRNGNIILMIIGLIFIILSPIFANLIRLAVSRRREFLADATGAKITRYPDGLANALEKLKTHNTHVKTATDATAHLFIASPLKKKISNLFSTHPPLDERIRRLRAM